jgi:hypothetical protein
VTQASENKNLTRSTQRQSANTDADAICLKHPLISRPFFALFVPFCGYSSFAMAWRKLKRAPR